MAKPLSTRAAVEARVTALQESLSDGDPEDAVLRASSEAVLNDLRAAYRADPKLFTPETIDALRELKELLAQTSP